ncbi:MAG: sodium:proton exchanger [Deltaproteobacteria bacterium HGW-Deltaproteobacteria-19]|jgi:CPA2 family monovalent cation:H+ antiporter-2|nr:MAG: sodium:proton exchanger [Deltaproteobacteria bacterium HGW-Deltaproteobacteria-19]
MNELNILITFAGGLAAALVFGYIAHHLKIPPLVGYLLAGILVGPHTPGFVANREVAEQFAEIGVILLLFGIGLRFHLRELYAVWRVAVPGALIQSTMSTVTLMLLLYLMGWNWISGLILGMAISVASTVVMARVLAEWHDLHAQIGHIAIGWTVVEDILTVLMLLLLPIIFATGGTTSHSIGYVLGLAALKVAGLVAVVVVLGLWVIPWALERIEKTHSRELFTLAVLVLAVGIAVSSAKFFGVSMALGAFLAGLAVGRSDFAARAAGDAVPMRDAFAVLFFVSVGMLFDPRSLLQSPLAIVMVLVVVIIIKPLAAMLTARILGKPMMIAGPVGAAFSQVGEFSFILGVVALQLELLNDTGWNALVTASIISIALNPFIYRWARLRSTRVAKIPITQKARPRIEPNNCILVGYGPVGKIVYEILSERGTDVTVIDLNLDTVRRLRADGKKALYGDVLRPDTLDEAGIASAGRFILSTDVENAAEIIRQARLLNPDLKVLARCAHLRDAASLRHAGAEIVAAGEAEVGVALAEALADEDEMACGVTSANREAIRNALYDIPG